LQDDCHISALTPAPVAAIIPVVATIVALAIVALASAEIPLAIRRLEAPAVAAAAEVGEAGIVVVVAAALPAVVPTWREPSNCIHFSAEITS
jgi:hypothetical protein